MLVYYYSLKFNFMNVYFLMLFIMGIFGSYLGYWFQMNYFMYLNILNYYMIYFSYMILYLGLYYI